MLKTIEMCVDLINFLFIVMFQFPVRPVWNPVIMKMVGWFMFI